jgi:hypothetical protein
MLRRVHATAEKLFPDIQNATSSHNISFEEAPHLNLPLEHLLHELVGDLQRIKLYADLGLITPQKIDEEVWYAYEALIENGYTGHLSKLGPSQWPRA